MLGFLKTKGNTNSVLKVKLDGKHCGNIKIVYGGWAYFPKCKKESGEVYKSIQEVKDSLKDI